MRFQFCDLQPMPANTQPRALSVEASRSSAEPDTVTFRSGTNTLPFQVPFLLGEKLRSSWEPISSLVPPLRASSRALALAHTTRPHRYWPHGWISMCTEFFGLRHTP